VCLPQKERKIFLECDISQSKWKENIFGMRYDAPYRRGKCFCYEVCPTKIDVKCMR
jgi:hypothetical protein